MAALREGPPQFWNFFYRVGARDSQTRYGERRHPLQLRELRTGRFLEVLRRSALGLVAVYNLLPFKVVSEASLKDFQKGLQDLVRQRAQAGCEDWRVTLSPRIPLWKHPLR